MRLSSAPRTALVLLLGLAFSGTAEAREPFLGEIMYFGGNFCPRGWAVADGSLISISSNSALFSLLGTMYGGDGRSTFGLPDLRGRVVMGPGTGPGLSNHSHGEKGGAETVTLTTSQLPAIEVAVVKPTTGPASGGGGPPGGGGPSKAGGKAGVTPSASAEAKNTTIGGGQAHSITQPYMVIQACIATSGTFPSRS